MNEFDRKIAELSARFAANAAGHRTALADAGARGDSDAVRDRAHRLAGIAGMLGQAEIGAAALELETAIEAGRDHGELVARLDRLLAELEAGA